MKHRIFGAAHGMTAAPAARDWPMLTVGELAPVLDGYPDIGPPCAVTWQSPRPFAASGVVATARGRVFIKRHHCAVRTAADLAEEHAFLRHLHAAGAPVPLVHARADGATASEHGGRTYEVHAMSPGLDLYRDDPSWTPMRGIAHAAAAGRALAGLHRAAAGYAATPRRTRRLVADFRVFAAEDPLQYVAALLDEDPMLAAALAGRPWRADFERMLLPWHAGLMPHLATMTPLWTHNDFHASNLLWRPDGDVATIFDFGLANCTSAVFDLATAIERNAIAWLELADGGTDIGRPELARAIIQGYGSNAAVLRHVLPLVHVDFALSELAYFHGVTRSAAHAELAYGAFLLGHAEWFRTPHGQEFLDAL